MNSGYEVLEFADRGRGIVARRELRAGEAVLHEAPALLTVDQAALLEVCSLCLRRLPQPGYMLCEETQQACFCSTTCAEAAEMEAGAPCRSMRRLLQRVPWNHLSAEEGQQVRFMLQALALRNAAATSEPARKRWEQLQGLGGRCPADCSPYARVHAVLSDITGADLPLADVAALLVKEGSNGYGIMAPSTAEGERRVRGSGIYPLASCLNHECLPNAARMDMFDSDAPDRTTISIRMLHNLPAGEEVVISYFPLHYEMGDRQQRCRELYGFVCTCPRCKGDAVTGDEAADDIAGSEASMMDLSAGYNDGREPYDPSYVQIFLMKYLCTNGECYGTYVPCAHDPTLMICNMCDTERSEAEFLEYLETQLGS